jgi:glycosyltransferase involved in cell wall biosynthesis
MSKPKILVLCDVKTWGGWQRAEMIKYHLSDEFEIDLMDQGEFDKYETETDKHFISIPEIHKIIEQHHKYFTRKLVSIPEILKFKKKKCKQERDYDLYYLMFHTMLCQQQVKRMMYGGCKFASAVTGLPVIKDVFANEKYAGKREAFIHLANSSVGFVANNNISLTELRKIYNGPTFYTPRGVDPDMFFPETKIPEFEERWTKPIRADNPFTVGFVGKADSGKNIRHIRTICSEAGARLHENQRNYTNALGKDEMRHWYNRCHALIVWSTTDGTPNPALEASSCGVPVLANRIGNMPEFLKDGVNGFFVDKGSEAAQMAEYIKKLKWMRNNPLKVKKMGERARQTVLDGWTWKHSMEYERKAIRGLLDEIKKTN